MELTAGSGLVITVDFATDPSAVKQIAYNVHGPHGVKVVKVTYFDDLGIIKEVRYHDGKKPGRYKTDILVDVGTMTASGISREYLLTSHQR